MGEKRLTAREISALAKKYLQGEASEEESKMLHEWYDSTNAGHTEIVMVPEPTSSAQIGEEILAGLKERIAREKEAEEVPSIRNRPRWWYAAAAVLVFIAGTIAYRYMNAPRRNDAPVYAIVPAKEVHAPQSARAVITLANGNKVFLNSRPNGTLAVQGATRLIKKTDGEVVYKEEGQGQELQFNVLMVPRGSRVVNITLTDGTRVWLNSESSMRYPVAFNGDSRKVEITGEAYFEVAKDPAKKFYVSSRGLVTEVLGTHFNVNSYEDELSMKVTLLEGSVHLTYSNGNQAMLKPGQQGSVNNSSEIKVVSNIDTMAVIAWKNDHFMMKGTDLGTLTRQMARWYDIEILFAGKIPDRKFGGSISRSVNLTTMLKALEESGIESRLEGRKVTIK